MQKKMYFWGGGVFFGFFFFAFILLQNLPFTFGDDLNIVYVAKTTSWSKLFGEFFHPFTQALYVHGLHCQLSTRVFQTIIFKLSYLLGGYQANFFWFHKAVGYGVCCLGVFLITAFYAQRILPGLLAAIFFGFCAPVMMTTAWLADSEIVAQAFLVMSLFFFIRLVSPQETGGGARWFLLMAGYFLAAWMAMKLKETARIIPMITLGYLILTWRHCGVFGKRLKVALLVASGFLLLSIIPGFRDTSVVVDERSAEAVRELSFSGLLTLSVSLLDYFFIPLLLICFFLLLFTFKRAGQRILLILSSCKNPLLIILIFWALFSMSGFMLKFDVSSNPRYITTPLIPWTILIFVVLSSVLEQLRVIVRNKIVLVALSVLVGAACFFQGFPGSKNGFFTFKLDEVLYVRNFWGGTDIAIHKMAGRVYSDYFNGAESEWLKLHDFYHVDKKRFTEMQLKEWDANQRFDLNELSKSMEEWGAIYVYSFNPDLENKYLWLNKIYESTTDNGSIYSMLIQKVKKKAVRRFYLYKSVSLPVL